MASLSEQGTEIHLEIEFCCAATVRPLMQIVNQVCLDVVSLQHVDLNPHRPLPEALHGLDTLHEAERHVLMSVGNWLQKVDSILIICEATSSSAVI